MLSYSIKKSFKKSFMTPRHLCLACVLGAALLAGALMGIMVTPSVGAAQPGAPLQPPITYLYLSPTGDTLGSEVISHEATNVTGMLAIKGQPRIEWVQAHANRAPGMLTLRVFAPGAAFDEPPLQFGTAETRGDSVFVDFTGGSQRTATGIASKAGAFPLVNASVLHASLLASYARQARRDSLNMFLTSGAQTIAASVSAHGDTTVLHLGTSEIRILSAPDGMPSVIHLGGNSGRIVRATSPLPTNAEDAASSTAGISYDAPASAPYVAHHVRIPSGRGYDLAATLTVPKGATRSPVVVTISGSGPQERDSRISLVPGYEIFRQIADTLGRRGIATLRFDDRAVGESGGREGVSKATSADFADDVRSIVAWLRLRADIDGSRIALAGHSEGGMIAPMVAASDPQLKAIALLAGTAQTGREIIMFQNRQSIDNAPNLSKAERDSIYASVPAQLDVAGKATPWLGYFLAHDPLITARKVRQPVLVLQGATDKQVTPEQAELLAKAVRSNGNKAVEVHVFPETNHLFLKDASGQPERYSELPDAKVRKDVLGMLADWASRVLK